MSILNQVKIELRTLNMLIERFQNGDSMIELSRQTGISKFRIRQALRKALGDEYWSLAVKILERKRSSEVRNRMSKAAKKRNANPEWAKKVIETKRQRDYFKVQAERHKTWMKDHHPTRGKKLSAMACANIATARQRFYDEGGSAGMHGKSHSEETKNRLREITRQMWKDGKFRYNSNGFGRSKLEISVFEEFLKHFSDVQHSFRLNANGRSYVFDVYVPSLNLLVEVNGDYWHLNPLKYAADHIDEYRNVTARGVWEADTMKCQAAFDSGYKINIIWESSISNDGITETVNNVIANHT